MKFTGTINLVAGGEILNLRVENLTADPSTPLVGQVWFRSTEKKFKYYEGTSILYFASETYVDTAISNLTGASGAANIGIEDTGEFYDATNVEAALQEIATDLGTEATNRANADTAIRNDFASTSSGKGASLVGVEDVAENFTATTVETVLAELQSNINTEASNRQSAITTLVTTLAATTNGNGASMIGVEDADNNFTATTVETVLAELQANIEAEALARTNADDTIRADLAATTNGKGASMVGVEDSASLFTATTVETVLAEIDGAYKAADTALKNDFASSNTGKGASMVGVADTGNNFTGATVEAVLAELQGNINAEATARTNADTATNNLLDNLEEAVGTTSGIGGINFTNTNFLTNGTSVVANLDALDLALKNLTTTVGNSDLQTVYENSIATSADNHAKIKLITGSDFRIIDDTNDSTYFMVDSETGNAIITGNLIVAGNTVQVNSQVTEFDSQQINFGNGGSIGLKIQPNRDYTPVTGEVIETPNGTATEFAGVLAMAAQGSIRRGAITITDGVETFTDPSGGGVLIGDQGGSGEINYTNGTYNLTFATAPLSGSSVTADYQYSTGYITPTADIVHINNNVENAVADFRINSAGQMIVGKNAEFKANVTVGGNIVVDGLVDGVDIAAFKTAFDAHLNLQPDKHAANQITFSPTGLNYISTTNTQAAVGQLDSEIKTINDLIGGTSGTSIIDRIEDLQEAIGTANGLTGMDYTSLNYVTEDTTVIAAISALDTALKTTNTALTQETTDRAAADTAIRNDLASVANAKGASLIGVEDADNNFTAATVEAVLAELQSNIEAEALAGSEADTQIREDLASTSTGKGATLIGVVDAASKFTAETVEAVLAEIDTNYKAGDNAIRNDLASVANAKGASLIGVEDAADNFTATTVEGTLAELQDNIEAEALARTNADTLIRTDLAAVTTGKGASLIGIEDDDGLYTSATVEDALTEIATRLNDSSFTYTSSTPATTHTITHNFGKKYCSVTVVDNTDNVVIPQSIVFVDNNSLTVSFSISMDCVVHCSI